jgi:hypothetical protein
MKADEGELFLTGLTRLTGLGNGFRQEEHEGHEVYDVKFYLHVFHVTPV